MSRFLASCATVIFVAAMASSVIVMFRRPNLEQGQLGYAVIWLAFILLYRIGHARWSKWDRVERNAAYAESPKQTRSRMPVWISMAGFIAAGVAIVLWILPGLSEATVIFAAIAIVLVVAAVIVGGRSWRDHANPDTQPSAVESARGKV